MPRITTVKKAQKPQGKCGKCGAEIHVGDPYRHTTLKTGQRSSLRKVRCMKPECSFRPSELTTSRRGEVYAAQEAMEDNMASWGAETTLDDITGELSNTADELRAVAEQYREAAENIEQGFQHETYQSQELNETADSIDSYADEVENAAGSCSEFDMDDYPQHEGDEDAAREEWLDDIRSEVESALGGCPV